MRNNRTGDIVEGFAIADGQVQPDLGAIADFSDLGEPAQSVAEAKRFIEATRDRRLAFDFTLADDGP